MASRNAGETSAVRPSAHSIRPNPKLVALVTYACEHVAQRLLGQDAYAEWLAWELRWNNRTSNPGDCVAVAQGCFAHKSGLFFPTLGQLCWAGKEAFYSTDTGGWLVLRYVADAMATFAIAFPESGLPLLNDAREHSSPRQVSNPSPGGKTHDQH